MSHVSLLHNYQNHIPKPLQFKVRKYRKRQYTGNSKLYLSCRNESYLTLT